MQTGSITITTAPIGAKIYVDNALVLDDEGIPGLTPAVLTVPVGYHSIRLELVGYCDEFDGGYIMQGENINVFHNFYICK